MTLNMKKRLLAMLAVAAIAVCAFAGCGADSNDGKCDKCGAEGATKVDGTEYCVSCMAQEALGALFG